MIPNLTFKFAVCSPDDSEVLVVDVRVAAPCDNVSREASIAYH